MRKEIAPTTEPETRPEKAWDSTLSEDEIEELSHGELRQLVLMLQQHAHIDPLTGLGNRRRFDRALERLGYDRTREFVSLVLFDIDHFKRVNDTYGHAVGDGVLREFGRLIKDTVRRSETVCRIGGEEFAVLTHHAESDSTWERHTEEAVGIAKRIRRTVEDYVFAKPLQDNGSITVSVGVSVILKDKDDRDCPSLQSLYESADKALYEAKRGGRNRVRFAACR